MESGDIASWPFVKEATGGAGAFYMIIIGNLMFYQDRLETYLLQLFAHPDTSEWFSIISVMNFEVNNGAEQKQALLITIFLFFKVFILLNSFTAPLTHRCPGVPGKEGKIVRCDSLVCTWCRCESRTVARKSSIGGALRLCRGLEIHLWQKFHWFIVFHISIWGTWSYVSGG